MNSRVVTVGVAGALAVGLGLAVSSRAQDVVPRGVVAQAAPAKDGWYHEQLEAGIAAAQESGKPLLVAFR